VYAPDPRMNEMRITLLVRINAFVYILLPESGSCGDLVASRGPVGHRVGHGSDRSVDCCADALQRLLDRGVGPQSAQHKAVVIAAARISEEPPSLLCCLDDLVADLVLAVLGENFQRAPLLGETDAVPEADATLGGVLRHLNLL